MSVTFDVVVLFTCFWTVLFVAGLLLLPVADVRGYPFLLLFLSVASGGPEIFFVCLPSEEGTLLTVYVFFTDIPWFESRLRGAQNAVFKFFFAVLKITSQTNQVGF